MSLCGSDLKKEKLQKRLKRIEGQVRGLAQMVQEERECIEVIQQIASVSGALRGVWTEVVGDHLRGCIRNALLHEDNGEKLIDELISQLQRLR